MSWSHRTSIRPTKWTTLRSKKWLVVSRCCYILFPCAMILFRYDKGDYCYAKIYEITLRCPLWRESPVPSLEVCVPSPCLRLVQSLSTRLILCSWGRGCQGRDFARAPQSHLGLWILKITTTGPRYLKKNTQPTWWCRLGCSWSVLVWSRGPLLL